MTAPLGYMLIGNPDFSEQLMRVLELKGDVPQVIVPWFQPVAQSVDFTNEEYQFTRRINRWQGGVNQAPVAAQFGYAILGRNAGPPNNRTAIAVIERVIIANANAASQTVFIYMLQNAAAPGIGGNSGMVMDDRNANPATGLISVAGLFTLGGTTSVTDFHPAGIVAGPTRIEVPATNTVIVPGPWILTGQADPGFTQPVQFVVQGGTVNQALTVTIVWRERALLPSER